MMTARWFNDRHAERTHAAMHKALKEVIEKLCPGHELSHFGINRNDETEEVQIRLHLNPLGRVRVMPNDRDRVHDRDQLGCCDPLLGTSNANR
jgi:hypothetical protein